MRRKISGIWIFYAVYIAIFLVFYIVLPIFFSGFHLFQNYFPLFFFFPFIFGRRGMRNRNAQNTGKSPNNPQNGEYDLNASSYDTADWEKRNSQMYDEYGIPKRAAFPRYLIYIGMAVVVIFSLALLILTGFINL